MEEVSGQVFVVLSTVAVPAHVRQTSGLAPAQEAQLLATVHWTQVSLLAERP